MLIIQKKYKSIGFRFGKGVIYVAIHGLKIYYGDRMSKEGDSLEFDIMKEEIQVIKDLVEGLGLEKEALKET